MSLAPWVTPTTQRQGQLVQGTPPRLQKGAKFIQRATGAIELRLQYKLNTVDVPQYLPTPQQVAQQYDNFWLDTSETDELELGITLMSLTYLGVNQIPPPRYFLRCNKISAPIDTNVNFPLLVNAAGGFTMDTAITPGNPGRAIQDAYGQFLKFGAGSLDPALIGVSTFDDTAISYVSKFVSASRRLDLIRKIETITTPDGNPPIFSNRNWKLSDITENEIGPAAFFEYEVLWELSGQGGWYPGIYGSTAQAAPLIDALPTLGSDGIYHL